MSYSVSAIEDELFKTDVAILAAEDWSTLYGKDPKSHAKLIRAEAGMMRTCRRFFKLLSQRASSFADWSAYEHTLSLLQAKDVQAADDFNVDVIVNDIPVKDSDNLFMQVIFEDLVVSVTAGAQAGEQIYAKYLGIQNTDAFIQQVARTRAANLVGKTVDKNGNIVDNPKASYRISDKTREDIRSSIRTSLSLREDRAAAIERMRSTINNAKRAEVIAQTEAVNAYQGGLRAFGGETGAIGKEWQDVGATDECADNSGVGVIPIDEDFPSGDSEPTAHPNCRCGLRLVYPGDPEADSLSV